MMSVAENRSLFLRNTWHFLNFYGVGPITVMMSVFSHIITLLNLSLTISVRVRYVITVVVSCFISTS